MQFFKDFNFSILDNPEFEESGVREEIITPILSSLDYKSWGSFRIIREKRVEHPFIQTGSSKKKLTNIPDYILEVNGKYKFVLDAKDPNQNIKSGKNVEQVYFYAIHPEIRVEKYALCNGREFALYDIHEDDPQLYFQIDEIDNYWHDIKRFLSPDAFIQKDILKEDSVEYKAQEDKSQKFDYLSRKLLPEIKVRKQAARRHYGVHGYFTKQSWNVVQEYIKNYTQQGDLVLDPFGGSGVTAIEALMVNRKGIHVDLNKMSTFLVDSLTAPVNINELRKEFKKIEAIYKKTEPKNEKEYDSILKNNFYPKGIKLMKNADVENIEDLFSKKQLAQLAYLRSLIMVIKDDNIRKSMLLCFSTSLTKLNLTYHNSKSRSPNAGNTAAFAYYRYRIAKEQYELPIWDTFEGKFKNIINAKEEIKANINEKTIENLTIKYGSATNLDFIEDETVDYIYTDPPYGDKIPYLDLSVMWNAWLGNNPSEDDYKQEIIEGGELKKGREEYFSLLELSMKEMYRVLKYNRWMSFVFAHKDPTYWHFIVDTAEKLGFEYAGSVRQANGQTSYKKRTMSFSVLAGQLIINFKKVKSPQIIQKSKLGESAFNLIMETIESVIAENDGAKLEDINDELIVKGLEFGFLDLLSKEYKDLTPLLMQNFDYDEETETFYIRENNRFKTNIPLNLRIKYFLISYLKRKHYEGFNPTTDEIILDVMPLLKNGITPENQTILKVLEKVAEHTGDNRWKLKSDSQTELFN